MRFTAMITAVTVLAATTLAAPTNTTLKHNLIASESSTLGISLWGFSHLDCQADLHGRPRVFPTGPTFKNMVYNRAYTVDVEYYSFSLTRPLAQHEELQFYSGDLSMDGTLCETLIDTEDWTLPGNYCAVAGWGSCVKLIRK